MKSQGLAKLKMPSRPGVYFFLGSPKLREGGKKGNPSSPKATTRRGEILYIGKATSLRDRVRSYFGKDLIATRGPLILDMVTQATAIDWEETDSVLEALILEAALIKKHQPKYNTKEKDNKSWNYVCITKETIPKVLVVRGRNILQKISDVKHQAVYGPFTNGMQLRDAMKIIRRIFPYIDEQSSKKQNTKFYQQLGLAPEVNVLNKKTLRQNKSSQKVLGSPHHEGSVRPDHFDKTSSAAKSQYLSNIANLKLFFQGKKKKIIQNLKKDMMKYAKEQKFERAHEVKRQIFALTHINDVALIKEDLIPPLLTKEGNEGRFLTGNLSQPLLGKERWNSHFRIESYDIAHMSGKNMVGVMIVVEDGKVAKSEYKKFIIRTQEGANDTGALEEVLSRRFRHTEWGMPSLVVMDGSTAQINVAKRVLNRYQFDIPIVAVVKDDKHKAKAIIGNEEIIKVYKKDILLANSESHRFGIAFHKQKRNKNFLK